jgi:GTP cyclohydrolase I
MRTATHEFHTTVPRLAGVPRDVETTQFRNKEDGSTDAKVPACDLPRIERAVREILLAVGEDPDREGLVETPARVARSYAEILSGLRQSPAEHLGRVFGHEGSERDMVAVRNIDFQSLCEHHLLPFVGTVHVAYFPEAGRVVGLSKIARTVDVFARRPQMQERLTAQIADAISEYLGSRGVAVIVSGEHQCMRLRGARKEHATMVTSAFRGILDEDPNLQSRALAMFSPASV